MRGLVAPVTAAVIAALAAMLPAQAHDRAGAIWSFRSRAAPPTTGLIADAQGNLFGTAGGGSTNCGGGCGSVFELSPPDQGKRAWTFQVLHFFYGLKDGAYPGAQLAVDASGVLYGYTSVVTPGSVFSLTKLAGGDWKFDNLYTFTGGADGSLRSGSAALLPYQGHLYGVAPLGGNTGCGGAGCGTLFRLDPPEAGKRWEEHTLLTFTGHGGDGAPVSLAGPDSGGALYIATSLNGGEVLRYDPSAGQGRVTILARFSGKRRGAYPGNLVLAANGQVYGLASLGRRDVAFQLTPPQAGGSAWAISFSGPVSAHGYPATSLAAGPDGSLIGTVYGDVDFYPGDVFALTPPGAGSGWQYNLVWRFAGGPTTSPLNVIAGGGAWAGDLFGVLTGGDETLGAVYDIRPGP